MLNMWQLSNTINRINHTNRRTNGKKIHNNRAWTH